MLISRQLRRRRQRHRESRATEFAVPNFDGPAHQLDEPVRDRQTQARRHRSRSPAMRRAERTARRCVAARRPGTPGPESSTHHGPAPPVESLVTRHRSTGRCMGDRVGDERRDDLQQPLRVAERAPAARDRRSASTPAASAAVPNRPRKRVAEHPHVDRHARDLNRARIELGEREQRLRHLADASRLVADDARAPRAAGRAR